jgi:hypothetical protein
MRENQIIICLVSTVLSIEIHASSIHDSDYQVLFLLRLYAAVSWKFKFLRREGWLSSPAVCSVFVFFVNKSFEDVFSSNVSDVLKCPQTIHISIISL